MYVPTPIIARNLKVLAEVMHFGTVEVNGMQHGEPLTVSYTHLDVYKRQALECGLKDGSAWIVRSNNVLLDGKMRTVYGKV